MPARRNPSNDPEIRIRRAAPSDLAALIELENSVFTSDRMSARQLRHHLRNASAAVLVAMRNREIAGSAVLLLHAGHRSARLYSIAVSTRARGAGVGKALLAAVERVAREDGRDLLRLEVRKENKAARTLYEQHGYRRFGMKRRYYEDGHDAERYEKTLARRGAISSPFKR